MDIEFIRSQLQIAANAIENIQSVLPEPTTVVEPGDDIQAIINAAEPGSILEFIPGATYVTGSLNLANKPITLRCRGILPDRRISPTDFLPVFKSGGPFSTINGTNATGLKIIGIFFTAREDGNGDVIVLDNARDVVFDKIVILGGVNGQKRGIRGNGERITLKDSYIANIWREGQDSQTFCAWNGAGPYTLYNSYLEAAGENVMFGGADSVDEAHIPADILIQGCEFVKRDEWKLKKGFYSVKNLIEFKCARRVLVYGCSLSGCWTDAQTGFGILIKSANQNGTAPWSVSEHIVFDSCIMNSDNGINIQGTGTENVGGKTTDITFRNCHILTKGIAMQIGANTGEVTVQHCTFENGYTFLFLYSSPKAVESLKLENTIGNHNQYGVKGDSTGIGQPSLDKFVGALTWKDNLLIGSAGKPYPPTTYNSMSEVPVGVSIGADI